MRAARASVPHPAVRRETADDWERVFGALALCLGMVILLSDLPSLWLGPLFGALFVLSGALALFRVLPGRRSTAAIAVILGGILFAPLTGLGAVGLQAYEIVVGAGLGAFGILKIT